MNLLAGPVAGVLTNRFPDTEAGATPGTLGDAPRSSQASGLLGSGWQVFNKLEENGSK